MPRFAFGVGCSLIYFLVFMAAFTAAPVPPEVVAWSLVQAMILIWLTVVDLSALRLPNAGTLTLAALGVLATFRLSPDAIGWHLGAAAAAYGVIFGANALYRAARGQDGIGGGDAKLLMAAGAWVGPSGTLSVFLTSTLAALAAFAGAAILGRGIGRATRIPFGPFLCFALWVTWLFGPLT